MAAPDVFGDGRGHARGSDRRRGRARDPRKRAGRPMGHGAAARGVACASSASTCRSRNGRRKKASPTRRSASASPRRPRRRWRAKAAHYGDDFMRMAEKSLLLQIPRSELEGPSAPARSSAPGHQSARLRAARSAERIQARGLRAVRRDAGASARARDRVLCHVEVRVRAAAGRGTAPPPPPLPQPLARRSMRETRREPAMAGADGARRGGRCRGRGAVRAHAAQRALPLRLGQEIQALPRPGLTHVRRSM